MHNTDNIPGYTIERLDKNNIGALNKLYKSVYKRAVTKDHFQKC